MHFNFHKQHDPFLLKLSDKQANSKNFIDIDELTYNRIR